MLDYRSAESDLVSLFDELQDILAELKSTITPRLLTPFEVGRPEA